MTWLNRRRGPDPGDRTLLGWAAVEGRVLVTMDKDFGEIIFSEGAPHCGLVRLPDVPAERRIALMEKVLADHTQDLMKQSIVTVRGGRVRGNRKGDTEKGTDLFSGMQRRKC